MTNSFVELNCVYTSKSSVSINIDTEAILYEETNSKELTFTFQMTENNYIISDCIEHLFRRLDFLGYQLSHALGDLPDKELAEIADEYFKTDTLSPEDIVLKIKILYPFIKNQERLDSDTFSMLLNCDLENVQKALDKILQNKPKLLI